MENIKEKKWDKSIDPNKIFNINNGLDINQQDEQKKEFTVDDIDLSDNNFKIIYAGSIGTADSVNLILEAAKILKEKRNIKFLVYGSGDKVDELKMYCLQNSLVNVVFKGRVEKKYIPYICSKADVNIISAKQTKILKYGISFNKLFDYMNAGRPVLSIVKPNYDLLERYDCGFSLSDQSPRSIADAILRFYEMPKDKYDRMCVNAINAAKDYDYSKLTDKLEEVIEYAVNHHGEKK